MENEQSGTENAEESEVNDGDSFSESEQTASDDNDSQEVTLTK